MFVFFKEITNTICTYVRVIFLFKIPISNTEELVMRGRISTDDNGQVTRRKVLRKET